MNPLPVPCYNIDADSRQLSPVTVAGSCVESVVLFCVSSKTPGAHIPVEAECLHAPSKVVGGWFDFRLHLKWRNFDIISVIVDNSLIGLGASAERLGRRQIV